MAKTVLVYCVRHGSTSLNGSCFRGSLDVPLDEQGWRDAHALAYYFEPIDISHIVSSDLQRASDTAKVIAAAKGQPVHHTPGLRAWKLGEFSGQPKTKEVLGQLQPYIDFPDMEVPGGESLSDFRARAHGCFAEAIEIAERSSEPVLLVFHSTNIHAVGEMVYSDHKAVLVEPGGVVAMYAQDGQLQAEPIFKPRLPAATRASDTS